MNLLRLALAPVFVLALAAPALAEKLPLSVISGYLNGIKTAETAFTQINADGTRAKGMLYIQRPGRMRFEYAENDLLVLASGGQVAIFDPKSNQVAEQYPLKRTPLNLILAAKVNLGQARMVIGHTEEDGDTVVVAQDPEHPEYGTIRMVFSANPVALKRWTITDQSGQRTAVLLDGLQEGVKIGPSKFSIVFETERRKR
ncbi:outer membrane lipoprotein-sorting protein [Rhodobacter aestuarii]|uniref:Outer membrane lipoprotein-sorting protein n=1 Tax=Rhodobacter aestuarii TaxID=453582 RepID=A0A1N7KA20_9RHOB|nr:MULTISPECIES: outer membrane lipoprotein carrier protein LolA [Rhodobacter]PTV95792.1 outer membrane lipoprotein-sorting protein [Rhodobacter aestuarii]SIS58431.1 Outer membrane lipoprotein-sorting protein [Rhodobacter aestuarii]SOC17214.1 outer membrane lipoprotein-sorting protein [Rhodobacter sp. JA431]